MLGVLELARIGPYRWNQDVENDGELVRGCLTVRPPGPDVCLVCCGALEGTGGLCWSCRRIQQGLARRLHPVTPVSLTKRTSALYSALRQYKGKANSIAGRQQIRLAELVSHFLERHESCVAPRGHDLVTVVPSQQVPSDMHPLAATLAMVPILAEQVEEVLSPGVASVGRNVPDKSAYRCDAQLVEGRRVLLVDDTYTTGAHLHSAAAALEDAGARSVHLLVVGRHQDPYWPPAQRLLEWSASPENPWLVERCVRCWDAR
jgi:predicted amidophosphoribosyltransferase